MIEFKAKGAFESPKALFKTIFRENSSNITLEEDCAYFRGNDCISVEYGRINGTSFQLINIRKEDYNGNKIRLRTRLTNANGSVTTYGTSAKAYAKSNRVLVCVNSGIFSATGIPLGKVICDGQVKLDGAVEDNSYQKTIAVDSNGDLRWYEPTVSATQIKSNGCTDAVSAFVPLIENFAECESYFNLTHGNQANPRQIIGQYGNGDYFVFTNSGRLTNETGTTFKNVADFLLTRGVKFAFNLDGGGSTQTMVGTYQINIKQDAGTYPKDEYGRRVPTLFCFEI